MDRIHEHSLYATNHQVGGRESKRKTNSYIASDLSKEDASALDKFRKANRLLQKELNETKDALVKERDLSAKLKKKLELYQVKL
jgi:hypothetical protein